jgi:signal transduction histidine kinase
MIASEAGDSSRVRRRALPRDVVRRLAPSSFRAQIVASTVLLMAAVMLCVGVGVQILLSYTAQRDIDRVLEDRADAVVALVDANAAPGAVRLSVPEYLLDPGVRVYDARGRLVAGSMEREARDAADHLASVTGPRSVDARDELRLRAVPLTTSGGQKGVAVVSQETAPYERSELYAVIATAAVGLLVVVVTGVVASRVTRQALAPVTQMAERAADWSEHDLAHRFDLGPADNELARLGATLDALLDRVAMAIRSEQRLTSELAHELRTPLTSIQGSADLALMRGVAEDDTRAELEQIALSARAMADVITALVDVAREHGSPGTVSTCGVGEVVEELRALVPERLAFVDETTGCKARIAGPRELVVRALAPLVDNAAGHARTTVTVGVSDDVHGVALSVTDDGAGVDDRVRDRIFEVGASGAGGTGLGLGIALRIARSLGGTISVGAPRTGATFVVTLPRV